MFIKILGREVFRVLRQHGLKEFLLRLPSYMWRRRHLLTLSSVTGKRQQRIRLEMESWSETQISRAVHLKEGLDISEVSPKKVAIHLHCFYPDVGVEILDTIHRSTQAISNVHTLVTVVTPEIQSQIQGFISSRGYANTTVRLVPNIGRDLGPLFTACKELFLEFDYICHLHTKRSPHTEFGEQWRTYLVQGCIGSTDRILSVFEYFERHPECALLYPLNFSKVRGLTGLDTNAEITARILSRISTGWTYEKSDFPAGSMCWLRTSAFQRALDLLPKLDEYETEQGQIDGTTAHALERCLTLIPRWQGLESHPFWTSKLAAEIDRPSPLQLKGNRWRRDTPLIGLNSIGLPSERIFQSFNSSSMNIHWVIPDFGPGAGGHQTIFRIVKFLEDFGHRQTIWVQNGDKLNVTSEQLKERLRSWYQPVQSTQIFHLPESIEHISGDAVIATDCWTAYPVRSMSHFKEKFYLIQDFEPSFHPMGENYLTAENTYRFGLSALCAGTWLMKKAQSYGMWARSWPLCNDPHHYFPTTDRPSNPIHRIAFYSRANTPRRGVNLGLAALQTLHDRGIGFEAILFGQDELDLSAFNFPHKNLGIIPPKKLGELYRECDVGMVFSATNYSLIPLEMMACKLPVVELDVESTRTAFPENTVSFALPDPESIAKKIEQLIHSQDLRDLQVETAFRFSTQFNWEESARIIETSIREKLIEVGFKPFSPTEDIFTPQANAYSYKATVVIPTYNAGDAFATTLQKVRTQRTSWPYEILIIDSGSTDGTAELLRQTQGIRLVEIPKNQFQHGATRNLGIREAKGEFVAFLTQDAEPTTDTWLENLISGFNQGAAVAGVFGRHKSRPEHGPFIHRDIENHFNHIKSLPKLRHWGMNLPESIDRDPLQKKLTLAFYSDNNSAIRKSAWKKLPYPTIDWGEDQVWAWEAISSNLEICYCDDAIVYHSHDYDPIKTIHTGMMEEIMFARHFGFRFNTDVESAKATIESRIAQDEAFARQNKIPVEALEIRKRMIRDETMARNSRYFLR